MSTCLSSTHVCQAQCSQQRSRGKGAALHVVARLPVRPARQQISCRAQKESSLIQHLGKNAAATLAAALLSVSTIPASAIATEFDVMNTSTPSLNYLIDDAGVLNKTTKKSVNDRLYKIETETGYRLEVVTVRKLEFEADAFAFGDKLVAKWFPDKSDADKKGVMIIVTTGKDGAITGGPSFTQKVGDSMIDSVIGENIPIFTEQEKFNETVTSSVKRLESALTGQKDPGAPQRASESRTRTYKTKGETQDKKGIFSTIVLVLLGISVVVPMLQYWGYTSKE
ncbi:hypothetical protein ABBQ38_012385 [Trebouxia sp. C0009 RCD-2024]